MSRWVQTLLGILSRASQQLPELRYAWGIVGISAAAAIAMHLQGSGKAAVVAGGVAFVGFVAMVVATAAARQDSILLTPAKVLVWSIIIFVVIFLGFTVTAFAKGEPCNWALFLGIEPSHDSCPRKPERLVFDLRREVDFSALGCKKDVTKNDKVIFTDVVTFREGELPHLFNRKFNVSKGAKVSVTDLVTNEGHRPYTGVGGEEQYGSVNFAVDASKREARYKWVYENGYSNSDEGVGFTSAEPYLLGSVDVTYRFGADPSLTERRFDPPELEGYCTRKSNGFRCENLNIDKAFREIWRWAMWKGCAAT